MEASSQRESTAQTKRNVDSKDYVRTDYANNQPVALLPSHEDETEKAGNGRAYIQASAFRLSVFYDGYSPHNCINNGVIHQIANKCRY